MENKKEKPSYDQVITYPNLANSIKIKLEDDGHLQDVYNEFNEMSKLSKTPLNELVNLEVYDAKLSSLSHNNDGVIVKLVFDGVIYE